MTKARVYLSDVQPISATSPRDGKPWVTKELNFYGDEE